MSHTDLKLLSFLADSSPAVSPVIYHLVLFPGRAHLSQKKERKIHREREKERKKERKICEENQ